MDFAENKFYRKFEEILAVSQDLQDEVNIEGRGALRSLHEAASLSPQLDNLLKDLYSGKTSPEDLALHEVLIEWTKTAHN
jgi:hypothetical protein